MAEETRKGNEFPEAAPGANDQMTFWNLALGRFAHIKWSSMVQVFKLAFDGLFVAKEAGKRLMTDAEAGLLAEVPGKEAAGVAQTLVSTLETSLLEGVAVDGNTLAKLRALIATLQGVVTTEQGKVTALQALMQSNDLTLDTVQELVDYIKANKNLIDSVTTNKQDKLAFDASPTPGSTNPVTSGGLLTAFAGIYTAARTWAQKQTFTLGINIGNIAKPGAGSVKPIGINDNGDVVAAVGDGVALGSENNPTKAGSGKALAFLDSLGKLWRGEFMTVDDVARTLTLGSAGNPALLRVLSGVSRLSPQPNQPFTVGVNNGLAEALIIQNLETYKKYLAVKTSGSNALQGVVAVENFELDALIGAPLKTRQGYAASSGSAKVYFKAPNASPEADIQIEMAANGNAVSFSGTVIGVTATGAAEGGGAGMVFLKFEQAAWVSGGAVNLKPVTMLVADNTSNGATCGLEAAGNAVKVYVVPAAGAVTAAYEWRLYDFYMKY